MVSASININRWQGEPFCFRLIRALPLEETIGKVLVEAEVVSVAAVDHTASDVIIGAAIEYVVGVEDGLVQRSHSNGLVV